jgi:hypothetical protein
MIAHSPPRHIRSMSRGCNHRLRLCTRRSARRGCYYCFWPLAYLYSQFFDQGLTKYVAELGIENVFNSNTTVRVSRTTLLVECLVSSVP